MLVPKDVYPLSLLMCVVFIVRNQGIFVGIVLSDNGFEVDFNSQATSVLHRTPEGSACPCQASYSATYRRQNDI
jgi:hypothetical protein